MQTSITQLLIVVYGRNAYCKYIVRIKLCTTHEYSNGPLGFFHNIEKGNGVDYVEPIFPLTDLSETIL